MSPVALVPIGNVPDKLLQRLATTIHEVFRLPVSLSTLPSDPSLAYDPYRDQYNSTVLLSFLLNSKTDQQSKILGVTEYDLFVPVLTYVFGEAQLNGSAAIVSSFRLKPELYGLPVQPDLVESRFEKEAIHELGHTFGLIHCDNDRCVMHPSSYAEEIDFKDKLPCTNCLLELLSYVSSAAENSKH